jgi:homocysteine S-methyltransferase
VRPGFAEALQRRVVLFDGAMGTEIYRRGVFINRAFEELNQADPDVISAIHRDYVRAGAEVITTNTFGGSPIRLRGFGLEERMNALLKAGVDLARAAAGERAWVAACIGPLSIPLLPVGRLEPGDAFAAFRAQAAALQEAGPDLFLLETFYDVRELWQAVRAVRSVSALPLVACIAVNPDPVTGGPPADAVHSLRQVASWNVDAVGVNCGAGPRTVLELVESALPLVDKPIVAQPNAGQPQDHDGRRLYMASPEYMAEFARRLALKGARGIGGCCGTTPEMIREMRSFLRSVSPVTTVVAEALPRPAEHALAPVPAAERSDFARRLLSGRFCVSVELDPPRGLDPTRSVRGAAFLREHGIDVINIADGPRAVARMGPLALGLMAREACGVESVVHYCCRDRNLLGMQMDLIGANALGMRNVLAVTGDPPKMGTYPDATPVFDIDSIGLITFIQQLNRGLDFSGRPLGDGEKTSLFVGAGCNPAHVDPDREVTRFGLKVAAGAEFFFSQPVYDEDVLFRFLDRTDGFPRVPFLVGILPLASFKNAEFLHNEVPGMQIPEAVRERLRRAGGRDEQREVGIAIARETLQRVRAHPRVSGVYIYPPFGSYQRVLDVVKGIVDHVTG